ncbi:hypothetical protein YC2023_081119 [Brassica napus]
MSALTTVVPPPVTLPVTALPLETWDFLGSMCGFTGVSLGALVGHLTLPKSTHMSSLSSPPDLATNYSHRLSPTLASYLAVIAGSTVQECGFAKFTHYDFTDASPSHYAISSIDGSSQGRLCGSPPPFLVAGTTVQECGFARSVRYHITAASPSYYAVSSIDGSSKSQLCDLQLGAAIFNRSSRMSCSSRTPIHRVFTDALRPLFIRAKISPSAEALTTTTTITPQAVVKTFTFRLERFSTFSGELLESSPRFLQVPVFCCSSSNWTAFFWVGSPTPMASDSPSLLQRVSMEGQPPPLSPAIHASSETWLNCSQNPMIGFFKVDFDVCAFLRTQALGLQVKLLFGSLLSLATSIFHLVLVIFVYELTVENRSGCNRLSLLGF